MMHTLSKKQFAALFMLTLSCDSAFAAVTGSLPWDAPLELIASSITGTVAYYISVISLVTAGGMLLFGGDLNRFGQTLIYLVLIIAFIIAAVNTIQTLFGVGAVASAGVYTFAALWVFLALTLSTVVAYLLILIRRRYER